MPDRVELTANQSAALAAETADVQLLAALAVSAAEVQTLAAPADFFTQWGDAQAGMADGLKKALGLDNAKLLLRLLNHLICGNFRGMNTSVVAISGSFGAGGGEGTGVVRIYPRDDTSHGHVNIDCEAQLGSNNYFSNVTFKKIGQNTTLEVPDPEQATAAFVLTTGTQSIGGSLTFTNGFIVSGSSVQLNDISIITGITTGTKLATDTDQKLGFWGKTPITRPSAYTQTYATADKTHADLTSSSVAAAGTQTDPWGFASQAAFDSVINGYNALRADLTDLKQLVNSVIDDLQAMGLAG